MSLGLPSTYILSCTIISNFESGRQFTMSKSTWFLLPNFTFKPGGQIALGMVTKNPEKPTLMPRASLSDVPSISPPEVTTIVEKDRAFSIEKNWFLWA
jgi:hypothetical protein